MWGEMLRATLSTSTNTDRYARPTAGKWLPSSLRASCPSVTYAPGGGERPAPLVDRRNVVPGDGALRPAVFGEKRIEGSSTEDFAQRETEAQDRAQHGG